MKKAGNIRFCTEKVKRSCLRAPNSISPGSNMPGDGGRMDD